MNTTQIVAAKVRQPIRKTEGTQAAESANNNIVSNPTLVVDGKEFPVTRQIMTIGRHIQNDIILSNQAASRFHCRIARFNGIYLLQDLNSTNGVIYQGDDIVGPVQLKNNDVFYIADTQIVLRF